MTKMEALEAIENCIVALKQIETYIAGSDAVPIKKSFSEPVLPKKDGGEYDFFAADDDFSFDGIDFSKIEKAEVQDTSFKPTLKFGPGGMPMNDEF